MVCMYVWYVYGMVCICIGMLWYVMYVYVWYVWYALVCYVCKLFMVCYIW